MLSAIVLACDASQPHPADPEAVVASLAALVPAVLAGLVREASLAVTAGDEAMQEIADHAGCRLVEAVAAADVLPAALAAARGPGVLVLRAGCVPEQSFPEEIADFLRRDPDGCALFRQTPLRGLARIFPSLAPVAGLLGTQSRMLGARRASLADLARALRASRVFRCRTMHVG
jgi:hypothetical protein